MSEGIDAALARRRILVTCGTGGVGKTTLSAAIALRAALSGRRTVVVTIDPATGTSTGIGALTDSFSAIAFAADGTLFGLTGDGASNPNTLYLLNKMDASQTMILQIPSDGAGESLAFNPTDGLFYRASGLSQTFQAISATNALARLQCAEMSIMLNLNVQQRDNLICVHLYPPMESDSVRNWNGAAESDRL